ncbi:MAG: hypothetical protein A3D74_00635 [Candidatus Levybacteria bacterium RIFCSPHIGHO2_02_FULL_37_13]|nr:MAG: hypothetical protein A3D74_00635 [Candidatus Levybacteria bacterium RIFCSPHIGHO2_02_FULL_37_13]
MENNIIEASYPITFRKEDAASLGAYLKNRQSVVLIGMKRVGISNFLRFFLNHKDIAKTYIGDEKSYLFIPVDLNDLVEREVGPFWILTLKRILDVVNKRPFGKGLKKKIEMLFLDSIQSQDLFLTIDCVRRSLIALSENGIVSTIFFLRFDRMKDAITHELFANLQGLKDATHHKLSYVFTSVRGLDDISPSVFTRTSLSVFSKDLYIKPAIEDDAKIILKTYKDRYKLTLSGLEDQILLDTVDGYVQYLQLALIYLHEKKVPIKTRDDFFKSLSYDEEVGLQSEELWESLTQQEKNVTTKIIKNDKIAKEEKDKAKYLWDTGFVTGSKIFSPLFEHYVKEVEKEALNNSNGALEFTKKENLLFNYLLDNINLVCEREQIVEKVWPEVEALGVSDWAIDRLMARVRSKLKLQKSQYEIQTIKTRGYKLVESGSPR